MDGSDFRFPSDYHVRIYNDKLRYQNHYVSVYKTDSPSTLIYTIHKLTVNVVIHMVDSGIFITYIGPHKGSFKMPTEANIEELLTSALSSALDKLVTVSSKAQSTLF